MNNLKAIKISDLTPGLNNANKLIYSTQITPIAVAEVICFVIEDEYSNVCRVSIPANADTVHLVTGARIAFSNPIYKMAFDGRYSLIVHNISNISLLQLSSLVHSESISVKQNIFPTESKTPISRVESEPGLSFSEIGNKLFKEGRYIQAIIQYSFSIQINSSNAVFYSNRAQCYTKIGEFENSLTDIKLAKLFDPERFKYEYLVALGYSRIGDHKLSLELLKQIKTKNTGNSQLVKNLIKKEEVFVDNLDGKFDFSKMNQNIMDFNEENKIGEYIGPIRILNTPNHGRGIFTTRKVCKGENLCLVNAIEFMNSNPPTCGCKQCEIDALKNIAENQTLHPKVIEIARKSKLTTARLASLCDRSIKDVDIKLYSGCGHEVSKNFDTSVYPLDNLLTLSKKNLKVELAPNDIEHAEATHVPLVSIGIWLLTSFINHSCTPNVVRIYIGDVCIVRAITDISEGEEIFTSYFPLSLFPGVQDRSNFLGFKCDCKLCEFERKPNVRDIISKLIGLEEYLLPCVDVHIDLLTQCIDKKTISREKWLEIKNKLFIFATQLKIHITDEFYSITFQNSIIFLEQTSTSEADSIELLKRAEPFFSIFGLNIYSLFWWLFYSKLSQAENTQQTPLFQRVNQHFLELQNLLSFSQK